MTARFYLKYINITLIQCYVGTNAADFSNARINLELLVYDVILGSMGISMQKLKNDNTEVEKVMGKILMWNMQREWESPNRILWNK